RIKALLGEASRVAVIGAGWIGLEVTAAARAAGVEVSLFEAADLPLRRALGGDLRFGVQVAEITGAGGHANGVRLADGSRVDADAIIAGIGITPNTELAVAAGLEVSDGIVTNAQLRSSDPDIYAAGDAASALHPMIGKHI